MASGKNYYFPSGEGNFLGKEEKFTSSSEYFRKRRKKNLLCTLLSSTTFFRHMSAFYSNFPVSGPLHLATLHSTLHLSSLLTGTTPVPPAISPSSCKCSPLSHAALTTVTSLTPATSFAFIQSLTCHSLPAALYCVCMALT